MVSEGIVAKGVKVEPSDRIDWATEVKDILKGELRRRHKTYADLVVDLKAFGIEETEANIRNKVSRGSFTAVFFVQCLTAIGCETVRLKP